VSEDVPVPEVNGRRAAISGPRARQVSDAHGVAVTLPALGTDGPIKLVGMRADVAQARAALEEAPASGGATGGRGNGAQRAPLPTEELSIEIALHPVIIGKAGATINRLRDETGARIDLTYVPQGKRS
jgi:hypothetical protein